MWHRSISPGIKLLGMPRVKESPSCAPAHPSTALDSPHTAALSWDRSLPPAPHCSPCAHCCPERPRRITDTKRANYSFQEALPGGCAPKSQGVLALFGFFTGGFSTERACFSIPHQVVHSSTQQPNFLPKKKFIRKLSSRSQPWQLVEIA